MISFDGTIQFVKFVWDNKEIIFSTKNPKEKMDKYYKDLAWENTSWGVTKHPKVISDIGATSMSDMGKVMPEIMKRSKGKADGKMTQSIVSNILQQA